jgi:hypothetical protein
MGRCICPRQGAKTGMDFAERETFWAAADSARRTMFSTYIVAVVRRNTAFVSPGWNTDHSFEDVRSAGADAPANGISMPFRKDIAAL